MTLRWKRNTSSPSGRPPAWKRRAWHSNAKTGLPRISVQLDGKGYKSSREARGQEQHEYSSSPIFPWLAKGRVKQAAPPRMQNSRSGWVIGQCALILSAACMFGSAATARLGIADMEGRVASRRNPGAGQGRAGPCQLVFLPLQSCNSNAGMPRRSTDHS
jgi:hypothetical protein